MQATIFGLICMALNSYTKVDCKRLGHVCDMEFDECKGCIQKIMVPGCKGLWGFLTDDSVIVIPYCCIRQIGPDIILVDI